METIKTLASIDNATLAKAMDQVKATEAQKARAMKEIEDYRYMRAEIAKMFRR